MSPAPRPTRRLALTLGLSVPAAAALAACGGSSGSGGSGAASGEPQQGGTLTYLEPQTWSTLYPPAGGFYPNGGVVNNVTDRLLYQNPETLTLEPWIATALPEVNEDANQYTFTLREDATYSDGTPIDAENVVKNFDLYGKGDPARALTVSEAICESGSGWSGTGRSGWMSVVSNRV
ncbi:ABC-type transport system substrate-binding protein [Brachybacterium aquaticum]|uniref:ABC-type transport system substrate-binding protein n=1 Tax=Brachybacterium aquaticum TaxID=1432564 RepID=A0A841AEU2_9MICO|nr:ABC-type transport system substrate-binding protein [Brachybacterium aquaticum]